MKNKKYLSIDKKNFNSFFFIIDNDLKIIYTNRYAQSITNYNKSELKGKKIIELISSSEIKDIRKVFRNLIKEKYTYTSFETKLSTKNGKLIPIKISISLRPWKDKKAILVTAERLSKQTVSKKELKSTKELKPKLNNRQMRLLIRAVEKSRDLIIISDEYGKVLYANPASFEKHEAKKEDYLYQNVFKWFAPYELERAEKVREETIRKGFVKNKEFDIISMSGETLTVEMSAVSLKDNQGNLLGFAAILRDISKRKQIEKKLKDVLFEQEIINKTI
ncbi:MAG: PAS domain S-box protein, partial [Promethearchaeota archaeon]